MNQGLSGTLRLLAMLTVLVMAALAGLLVFDVIPREQLADTATKIFALLGIATVAAVALGALFKSQD